MSMSKITYVDLMEGCLHRNALALGFAPLLKVRNIKSFSNNSGSLGGCDSNSSFFREQ